MHSLIENNNTPWIGDPPKDWEIIPLKYQFNMNGRIGWKGLKFEEFTDEGPYLITGHDIKNHSIDWSKCYRITVQRFEESPEIIVQEKDLLFTKDGTIGKTLYIDYLPGKTSLNSHLLLIRSKNKNYSTKFLQYIFWSSNFFHYVDLVKTGTTFYGVSQKSMEDFKFCFPPIKEQKLISQYLDKKTKQIDSLIEKIEKKIELLNEQKTALINQYVTKGLDPNVEMKDSGFEWIGEIPIHWDKGSLKYFTHEITDGAHISPDTSEEDKYFVSTVDINEGVIDFDNCLKTSYSSYEYLVKTGCKPEENDILFSKDGTIGKTTIVNEVDFVVASSLIIIKPNLEKVSSEFLNFVLQSHSVIDQIESMVKGAALRRVSLKNMKSIELIIPPMQIQKEISRLLSNKIDLLFKSKNKQIKKIKLLQEYRQSLISSVVTGKIRITEDMI